MHACSYALGSDPLFRVSIETNNRTKSPLRLYGAHAYNVRFQYGIYSSEHQRRMFGTHVHMPDLVMVRTQIPGADLGLKVMQ